MDKLDRSMRKLERIADSSISLDDTTTCSGSDSDSLGCKPAAKRKVTKIMAMAGLPDLPIQIMVSNELIVFSLISEQISNLSEDDTGIRRFAGGNEWLTRTVRTLSKRRRPITPEISSRGVQSART